VRHRQTDGYSFPPVRNHFYASLAVGLAMLMPDMKKSQNKKKPGQRLALNDAAASARAITPKLARALFTISEKWKF